MQSNIVGTVVFGESINDDIGCIIRYQGHYDNNSESHCQARRFDCPASVWKFLKKKASNNLIIDTHQGTANSDDPIIVFQMAIMVTIELCVRLSSSFCPGRCKWNSDAGRRWIGYSWIDAFLYFVRCFSLKNLPGIPRPHYKYCWYHGHRRHQVKAYILRGSLIHDHEFLLNASSGMNRSISI